MFFIVLDIIVALVCGLVIFSNLNASLRRGNEVATVVRDSGNSVIITISDIVCYVVSFIMMLIFVIAKIIPFIDLSPLAFLPTLIVGILGSISKSFIAKHKKDIKKERIETGHNPSKELAQSGAKAVGNGAKAVGKGVGKVVKPVAEPLLESAQTVAVAGAKVAGTAALAGAAVATGPVGVVVGGATAAQVHHNKKVRNNMAKLQIESDERSKAIMEHAKHVGINTHNKSIEEVAAQAVKFASPTTLAELPEDMDLLDKAYIVLGCDKDSGTPTGQKMLGDSQSVNTANIKNNLRQASLEQNPKWQFIMDKAAQAGMPVENRDVDAVAKDVVKYASSAAVKQLPKDMNVIDKAYYILGGEQNEKEIIDGEATVIEETA